jgi:hypothetical protein
MLVDELFHLFVVCDPMTHRRSGDADLLCDLSSRHTLLIQDDDGCTTEKGNSSVAAGVRREQRCSRRRRDGCRCFGSVSMLLIVAVVALAAVFVAHLLLLQADRAEKLEAQRSNSGEQAAQHTRVVADERVIHVVPAHVLSSSLPHC